MSVVKTAHKNGRKLSMEQKFPAVGQLFHEIAGISF